MSYQCADCGTSLVASTMASVCGRLLCSPCYGKRYPPKPAEFFGRPSTPSRPTTVGTLELPRLEPDEALLVTVVGGRLDERTISALNDLVEVCGRVPSEGPCTVVLESDFPTTKIEVSAVKVSKVDVARGIRLSPLFGSDHVYALDSIGYKDPVSVENIFRKIPVGKRRTEMVLADLESQGFARRVGDDWELTRRGLTLLDAILACDG